jgi:TetR/AcrR family transcriptional repressor of nem operon
MGRLKEFDEDKAIDRAIDCFWARGYEATSVRDLAEHMGIGGASLYNAYGGKRALFATALERYADRTSRQRIARLEETGRPKEAIGAFFAELIDRSLADPQRRGCLFVNSALDVAPHDAEVGQAVAGYLDEVRAFFQRCIAAAQAAGGISARLDAVETSHHLLGVLIGLRVLARTHANRETLEAVAWPALRLLDVPDARPGKGKR